MTPVEARERALAILSQVCRVDRARLAPDTHLIRDLDLDSPTTLELLLALEEELAIEIPEVEAAKLVTVADVLAFVTRATGG